MNPDTLLSIGFRDIAAWTLENGSLTYRVDNGADGVALDVRNALYAFVVKDCVKYIGKTSRSLRRRFLGYTNPGNTQQTNQRCHQNILGHLNQNKCVRIFVFTPTSDLAYSGFPIDLAAGLEDSLIKAFSPKWNGGQRAISERAISEGEEREEAEATNIAQNVNAEGIQEPYENPQPALGFTITLRDTCYYQGFINPGVEASKSLGQNGEDIVVYLGSEDQGILSTINRTANANGSVRLIGNNAKFAQWFQKNFNKGEEVHGIILNPNRILLQLPNH